MINLKTLQKIKRSREVDNRDFIKGIRADRNEKVEDWPLNIFNIIFKKIKKHEFTAYYNTNELSLIEANIAKYFRIKKENFIINHGGDGVIKEFFFTNPNVVSNFDIGIKEMSNLCKNYPKKLFFIDESYNGYGQATFLNLIKKHKNIFIMRSITKSIGLASSRVGFLISHKESMKPFKALQTPYPLSLFAGKCLKFFIENKKLINSYNLKVIKGREYFCKELRKKKYLINNGNGLSILIFMRSNTNLKKRELIFFDFELRFFIFLILILPLFFIIKIILFNNSSLFCTTEKLLLFKLNIFKFSSAPHSTSGKIL